MWEDFEIKFDTRYESFICYTETISKIRRFEKRLSMTLKLDE
jgi:hypothetical protein